MERPPLINSHIYHVYNRGVEKRKIFVDKQDHFRFVHDLYEFNDTESAENLYYKRVALQSYEVRPHKITQQRKLLVEILAWCFMPNHFHLLLRQKKDNGISLFMQKLGTGYAMYFNLKYKRVGSLFQGRFKAILVENDNYLMHLSRYIHLNPIELIEPSWKINGIRNLSKSNRFLRKYRWSSYQDYIGKKNFPSITQRDFINQYFENPQEYRNFIREWLSTQVVDFESLKDLILE